MLICTLPDYNHHNNLLAIHVFTTTNWGEGSEVTVVAMVAKKESNDNGGCNGHDGIDGACIRRAVVMVLIVADR